MSTTDKKSDLQFYQNILKFTYWGILVIPEVVDKIGRLVNDGLAT